MKPVETSRDLDVSYRHSGQRNSVYRRASILNNRIGFEFVPISRFLRSMQQTAKFVNRELSWLEFNQRVLDEARDADVPLLERLKFLAITSSNLDEFFMVRVGGLHLLFHEKPTRRDPSGMTADQQLAAISDRTHRMTRDQGECYRNELEPALAAAGIRRVRADELNAKQAQAVENVFNEELFAVLSPMAVSGADDFPLLVHGTLNVMVQLAPAHVGPDRRSGPRGQVGTRALTAAPPASEVRTGGPDLLPRFAVIPFGPATSRIVTLPSDGGYSYMLLEDVVAMFIERFFAGETIIDCVPFRITRNADIGTRDDTASDLLAEMEEVLRARKESDCIRLEIADAVTAAGLEFLQATLKLGDRGVYRAPGPLDLAAFMRLAGLQGFDALKYEDWPPQPSLMVDAAEDIFEVVRDHDVLLHHPYESFEPVLRLIESAAADPDVLAIKQTLYRTSRNSPIVAALIRAAESGKSVTAIVELKARFDEARNIEWAKDLERAGGQVIYGVMGLKTHAKACLIVRREPHGIQRYAHFGTGNYNEITAKLYTDVSLLSCDPELTADAVNFFNAVTGYSQPQQFHKLEAAPLGLRPKILELIHSETERKRHKQEARITAKLNSLADPELIEALYEASQAGVTIKLNVRGICCLRPGVKGLSENIKVVSIIDRFLEHGRIFRFHHGGADLVYISSADWMPRNLNRRIELFVPVENAKCRKRVIAILNAAFRDNVRGRVVLSDGTFEPPQQRRGGKRFRSQEELYRQVRESVKKAEQARTTVFVPHRAPESE
jgi:polyphosphate kinase